MKEWTTNDMPPQISKLAIITGATGGLGYEIALALAKVGAEVIVAGRNSDKGRTAVERLQRSTVGKLRFEPLDLASLSSVRAFADRIIGQDKPIDMLVNNAGVMALPKRLTTRDGFEMQFGTNHLGHFALTGLLLPLLCRAAAPRVVTMSSLAQRTGKIDFSDLQGEQTYSPGAAYAQSKLANVLFSQELQRRSERQGWGITSVAAHPGSAKTNLIVNGPGTTGLLGWLDKLLGPFLSHSAAEGALPALFAATSPNAIPSGYYGPKNVFEMKGPVATAKIAPRALDTDVAEMLWTVSEDLTSVRF